MPTQTLRIKEVSRQLGVHPGSLRRAEREGRLPQAQREPVSQQRIYSERDIAVLRELLYGR